ncbi:hypothetical protein A0H81_09140 [Grifola frondosa]|uniref:F-box domain-containing protein n=1 Tax=Grifola frondosa TaxID=5627 RepID=A0A1C7M1T1_GRIFR|nr:hypothetical protein A0H81_09140 [Grifola frondosa]
MNLGLSLPPSSTCAMSYTEMTSIEVSPCYTVSPCFKVTASQSRPLSSCVNRRTGIFSVPDDILLLIISYVEVKDILSLRKTSRRLYSMTKLRWVWSDALKRHIIDRGLPVPAADANLRAFSAGDLEARAVHAAKLHENWYSAHPRYRQSIEFQADRILPDDYVDKHKSTVSQVLFLKGHNGELLVTVVDRIITCWEVPLDGSGAYRVAEWVSRTKIEQVVVNDDPKSDMVLAFATKDSIHHTTVEYKALTLDVFHGCFTVSASLRTVQEGDFPVHASMHAMHGDYVILGDPTVVWYCSQPNEVKSMGVYPSDHAMRPNQILAIKLINRYMIVVRERSFRLIYAPSWKNIRTTYNATCISSSVHMDVVATSSVVVARTPTANGEDELEWPSTPVTILSRYSDGGFDTLRQYDLLPLSRPKARSSGYEYAGDRDEPDGLPCMLPSQSTRVIRVPPSCNNLHVGSSGKGIWMLTRNVTSRRSVYPARCILGFDMASDLHGRRETSEDEVNYWCDSKGGNDLHVCRDVLYSRRCDMSEILSKKYSIVSASLDDTVGRIAIGDRFGKVEVLDLV